MAQEKLIASSQARRNAAQYALARAQSLPDQTPDGGRGILRVRRFFHACGERSDVMWQAFRAAVVEFAAASGTHDEMVGSAILTLCALREWCSGKTAHA